MHLARLLISILAQIKIENFYYLNNVINLSNIFLMKPIFGK